MLRRQLKIKKNILVKLNAKNRAARTRACHYVCDNNHLKNMGVSLENVVGLW